MTAHILVVNDTAEILDAFRAVLEDEGYRVTTTGVSPRDAREVERLRPDVVILDLVMGEEQTGWQTLELMKLYRATATIPVIICTAATRAIRDIGGDLLAKGVRLLPKPFDIDELLDMVRESLAGRRTDANAQREQGHHLGKGTADQMEGGDERTDSETPQ